LSDLYEYADRELLLLSIIESSLKLMRTQLENLSKGMCPLKAEYLLDYLGNLDHSPLFSVGHIWSSFL